jgi:ribosomal protein S17
MIAVSGITVMIMEARPLSDRSKNWRLVEILEKTK